MPPAAIAAIAAAATLVGVIIGVGLIRRRTRRVLERLAGDHQNSVGLYLRRKVAEAGLDPGDLSAPNGPLDLLELNRRLAETLLDHERRTLEMGDTQELGLARTMRLESTDELESAKAEAEAKANDNASAAPTETARPTDSADTSGKATP
jgi:hypothetical protein